jgi:Restriction endonuclease BglII
MARADIFEPLRAKGFQIEFHSHARAILLTDFTRPMRELVGVLEGVTIPIEEIVASGGGEAKGTQRLRRALFEKGWTKGRFKIVKSINDVEKESVTHEIDHVRGMPDGSVLALEIEWNNKDPFFDRDLENFKRLHAEGAISAGVLVTRGTSLQDNLRALVRRFAEQRSVSAFADLKPFGVEPTARQRREVEKRTSRGRQPPSFREAWTDHFVSDKFGAATTHWAKLEDRIRRGVGNPCPMLAIGLPDSIVTFHETKEALAEIAEGEEEESH